MMGKTNIYLGIILALVLLCSSPAFAGDESLGAQGMLSAREMRAVSKSGGVITSQSNVLNGGAQVRYGHDGTAPSTASITSANTVNNLNTNGRSAGPGGTTILSGTTVSNMVTNAVSQTQTIYTGGKNMVDNASYGMNRGASAAMSNAVNALQVGSNPVIASITDPVPGQNSGKSEWAPLGGQSHQALSETKAQAMDAYAAKIGLDMSNQNSHATGTSPNAVSGSAGTATGSSNPLAGTAAGDVLGLEPGASSNAAGATTVMATTVTAKPSASAPSSFWTGGPVRVGGNTNSNGGLSGVSLTNAKDALHINGAN
jgi:hypothetical protein